MSTTYKATIGLEVHAELKTKSKMFCGCKNDPHDSLPNTNICPVCLAHPGTLPVPNKDAVAKVFLFGEAVGAKRATYSEFDRKNYFYPDIPKAYQISQYAFPFLTAGSLCGVDLTRVHLEEDTARSQHNDNNSFVDFNRAGVPLMELVTEPVIHDAKTAGDFARELQLLLRTLDISDANMERGEMRVEANISVSSNETLGTKVEVKNLNSFKSVEGAIAYEIERQVNLIEGGNQVSQETRGWDEVRLRTFTQRSKETAKDYRYFPDPDIPKISVDTYAEFDKTRLNEIMPELPSKKRLNYKNLGLASNQIEIIIANQTLDRIFSELIKLDNSGSLSKLCANYLTTDVAPLISGTNKPFNVNGFFELMQMTLSGDISSRVAKDLLPEVVLSDVSPRLIAKERGLIQSSDPGAVFGFIVEVVKENDVVVKEYLSGKETSIQFLVGQCMKKSRGSANPTLVLELLKEELDKLR